MPPAKSLNGPAPGIRDAIELTLTITTTARRRACRARRVASVRRPRTPSRSAAGTRAPGGADGRRPVRLRHLGLGGRALQRRCSRQSAGDRRSEGRVVDQQRDRPQCRAGLIHQPGHVVAVGPGRRGWPPWPPAARSRPSRRWCRVCRSTPARCGRPRRPWRPRRPGPRRSRGRGRGTAPVTIAVLPARRPVVPLFLAPCTTMADVWSAQSSSGFHVRRQQQAQQRGAADQFDQAVRVDVVKTPRRDRRRRSGRSALRRTGRQNRFITRVFRAASAAMSAIRPGRAARTTGEVNASLAAPDHGADVAAAMSPAGTVNAVSATGNAAPVRRSAFAGPAPVEAVFGGAKPVRRWRPWSGWRSRCRRAAPRWRSGWQYRSGDRGLPPPGPLSINDTGSAFITLPTVS